MNMRSKLGYGKDLIIFIIAICRQINEVTQDWSQLSFINQKRLSANMLAEFFQLNL